MRPLQTVTATKLLQDNRFDIEFHGYLSNHAKHAIVALDRIVDTPWNKVQAVTHDEFILLRGKKSKWQEQVAFLQNDCGDDVEKLIRRHVPALLPGIAGGLTHGIIHLGWAIDAKSPWMALEGVAYLNFCNLGVDPNFLSRGQHTSDATPLDSYIRAAETFHKDDLASEWVQKAKSSHGTSFHPELVAAGFQWEASKLMADAHPVATEIPAWLDREPVDKVFELLYRTTTILFLSSRDEEGHSSFLLLHLITSLWGLEQVCRVINDEMVTRDALGQFYAISICLMASASFPPAQPLRQVIEEQPEPNINLHPDWSSILQRGMAETEEHNIKLVYVCHELWQRYGKWNGFVEAATSFTLTPNIGPKQTSYSVDS